MIIKLVSGDTFDSAQQEFSDEPASDEGATEVLLEQTGNDFWVCFNLSDTLNSAPVQIEIPDWLVKVDKPGVYCLPGKHDERAEEWQYVEINPEDSLQSEGNGKEQSGVFPFDPFTQNNAGSDVSLQK